MRFILADILTLNQHLECLSLAFDRYHPNRCPYCSHPKVWRHGCYARKADRIHSGDETLNPIPIPRFRCADCRRTFSVLPECIPPRRWSLWHVQQDGLQGCLEGLSFRQVSLLLSVARSTISRWFHWLEARSSSFQKTLCVTHSAFGYFAHWKAFWRHWFDQQGLSKAMWQLSRSGWEVP